ncbi:MAG: magnesium transporter, partial [Oscillibacter sp.]
MFEFENERTSMLEKIEEYLIRKRYAELRDLLVPLEAADIAQLCEDLEEAALPLVFRLLPKELAAEVFVELDTGEQELLI